MKARERALAPALLGAALILGALRPGPALAQRESSPPRGFTTSRWTYGGAIGLGFGDINWVSVSPQIGYLVTPRIWTGVSAMFQFSNDTRYDPDRNSTNYGFGVFGRYFIFDGVFTHAELSWVSYETYPYAYGAPETGRLERTLFYLGGGYAQPVGAGVSLMVEGLYDVTGNAADIYGTNFQFRVGVVAGF